MSFAVKKLRRRLERLRAHILQLTKKEELGYISEIQEKINIRWKKHNGSAKQDLTVWKNRPYFLQKRSKVGSLGSRQYEIALYWCLSAALLYGLYRIFRREIENLNKRIDQTNGPPVAPGLESIKMETSAQRNHTHSSGGAVRRFLESYTRDPRILLQLCQSKFHPFHDFGIEATAHKHEWEERVYEKFRLTLGMDAAVNLARRKDVDLRFFNLPTVGNDLDKLGRQLEDLLSRLPTENVDPVTLVATEKAVRRGTRNYDTEAIWSFDGIGQLNLVPQDDDPIDVRMELFSLHALCLQSKEKIQCHEIVMNGGLQVLQQVIVGRAEKPRFLRYVGKIISNISVHPELHDALFRSGWVGIMADWMKSEDLSLSLVATKVLSNMDASERSINGILNDGVYVYHPEHKFNGPIFADIVFIHGLFGNPVYTWRQMDPDEAKAAAKHVNTSEVKEENGEVVEYELPRDSCWPKKWLAKDCAHTRMLTIEYETELTEWSPSYENNRRTINARAQDMLQKLAEAGLGQRPIIWVGHSMGGLLIKNILSHAKSNPEYQDVLENSKGVVFFSVPNKGSRSAAFLARLLLLPSTEIQELRDRSPMLLDLHDKFRSIMNEHDIPLLNFSEGSKMTVFPNIQLLVVPPDSSEACFGTNHHMPTLNHLSICKPDSEKSPVYTNTLEFIRNCISSSSIDHTIHPALSKYAELFDILY